MNKKTVKTWLRIEKIRLYLFFALLIALLTVLIYQSVSDMQRDQGNYVSSFNDALDERMLSLYTEINNLPSGAGNDVLFLSNLADVADFVFNEPFKLDDLNRDFSEFLNQNIAYKRLTILKLNDQSVLNAERQLSGEITFDSTLKQSLVNDDFLSKIVNLEKDKVYISDLQKDAMSSDASNLILYYATPIFNGSKEAGGILILTVDPSYFLDDVRNFSRPGEQVFLTNSNGDYLANYDVSKEYINSQTKFNFNQDFPEVADEILSISDKRIIETSNAVFAFRYIQPTLSKFDIYKEGDQMSKNSFYWVLVSVSDRQNMDTILSAFKKQRFLFALIAIIIILFIGLLAVSMHWELVKKIKDNEL